MATTDTADNLLDVAERLFAEQGIETTSLRSLTAAAEANLAAVSYHFGSKEGLVKAVFARRLRPLNGERLARLAACEEAAGEGSPELEGIVRAFVEPVVRMRFGMGESHHFVRLMGRLLMTASTPLAEEILTQEFGELVRRFQAALGRALPGLTPEELNVGFHFMVGAMALSCNMPACLADKVPASAGLPAMARFSELLVQFILGGLGGLGGLGRQSPSLRPGLSPDPAGAPSP